jgi:predicted ATPase/class 3 adenylate cyclase
MSLPSGVVTFVFSDIEGSTRLWEDDPAGMATSLARHDDIVRTVIDSAGGTVFKHTGDGFAAAFDSVTAGVDAAHLVAASLASEPWQSPPLRSRIGVHSGEAEPRDGDYFGATITRTARLMDAGNGGQILLSEASRQLLGGRVPDGTSLIDEGEHRLKDLGEPVRIYRLVTSADADQRELRTLERAPHNLPIQLSTFVGREGHIKEVADLVRQSRLVTLTGIGGVGKTRLSLQVAAEVLADFADGAWFAELAPLAEPGLLADTVGNSMRVPPDSSLSAEETLMRFLAPRRALLVIDNCEHLIDDVATFVDTLLRRCPDVHVLATSREGLAVTGESLWRVPSLRVDDDAAAVELFAERARLVQPGFTVNDGNRATVADLCVRLDGIPLAIELATARLKMLSVEQIAEHLGDRFRLLTGGSRVAVERQRTLRAMMDWSHDLLSPTEQVLLRRLSVFSDGFDYEAAERVCAGGDIDAFDILDLLGHLVEASMVAFESNPRPRYRLLETVRQYALDKLFESGESEQTRLAHAEHFRSVSQLINDALERNDYTLWDIAGEELGNLRAALTWTIESGHGELALQIACNLRLYFWGRMMYRESIRWITTALALVDDDTSPLVATGASYALIDATNIEDSATIASLRGRVEALLDSDLPDSSRGELANALAAVAMSESVTRSDQLYKQAHDLLRAAGNPRWGAPVQNRLLTAWFMNSREHQAEVLRLTDEATSEGINVHATVVRTGFLVLAGEYETVIRTVAAQSPVDDWERGMLLLFRAHSERALGRFADAVTSVAEATKVFASDILGAEHWETAMLHLQTGDVDAAVATYETADQAGRFGAASRLDAVLIWSLAAERRADFERAAILAGFAEALARASSLGRLEADMRIIEASRREVEQSLGPERYADHYRRGSEMEWAELPRLGEAGRGRTH